MVLEWTERSDVTSELSLSTPLYSGDRAKEMGHWAAIGESSDKQGQNAVFSTIH